MFSCHQYDDVPRKTCRFKDVSPCRDQVSKHICNEHARIFGLAYRVVSYTNGNNDCWSSIESYICSNSNFHLPLFIDTNCEVLMSEIQSFALAACNTFPNIKLKGLEDAIACLMNLSAYDNNCTFGGWLDDENTRLIVQNQDGVQGLSYIPPLHRLLFHHSKPSLTRNSVDGSQIYLVPNVSLQYDVSNSTAATYHFVVPNKEYVLKYTDNPDCVATPLVLNAIRKNTAKQITRKFRHTDARE